MKKIQKLWFGFLKIWHTILKSNTALLDLKIKLLDFDFLIGVIGHRELLTEDCKYLKEGEIDRSTPFYIQIEKKIDELISDNSGKKIALISPLAKGADQIVAQVARDKGLKVICVLPFNEDDYLKKMETSSSEFFRIFEKEATYVIVNPKTTKESEDLPFELVGKFITLNCNTVLFLWDGVFTGGQGGTSQSYHQATNGFIFDKDFTPKFEIRKVKKHRICHLTTPKIDNPYPAGKRYTNSDKDDIADYSKVYAYQWHDIKNIIPLKRSPNIWESLSQSVNNHLRNRFVWMYVIPAILIFVMTIFWALGYIINPNKCPWQTTESILKLIKMPGTDLADDFLKLSVPDKIAMAIGIFVLAYSVLISLIYLLSNDRRIGSLWVSKKKYNLILGLGWKGIELASNLNDKSDKNRKKVVVIEKNEQNVHAKAALRKGIKVIFGNFNESFIFNKIRWQKADDIYVLGQDDETNIRTVQLLDSMSRDKNHKGKEPKEQTLHIHLDDFRNKFFVNKALQNKNHIKLNCFNIYENSIRRLLLRHPLDRFHYQEIRDKIREEMHEKRHIKIEQADGVKIILLGFNQAAQALFRHIFTHCIYEADKKVNVELYLANPDVDIRIIRKDIPYVFKEIKAYTSTPGFLYEYKAETTPVSHYVYGNFTIRIYQLPESEYGILEHSHYLKEISQKDVTSVFSCIDDGLKSSAYLSVILPALEVKKQEIMADIQAYCYFNFPEEKENTFIEESINKIAKTIPVFFFGNFSEEFTEDIIKNQELDQLAKWINAFYCKSKDIKGIRKKRNSEVIDLAQYILKDKEEDQIVVDKKLKKIWERLDEFKKESNRLAADHIFIKIRHIENFYQKDLKKYSEIFTGLIDENSTEYLNDRTKETHFHLRGFLKDLVEMEHRRWCAERLFYGWKPFNGNSPDLKEWENNRKFKYEPIKNHIDLKNYESLEEEEKDKDLVITENIDLMLLLVNNLKS